MSAATALPTALLAVRHDQNWAGFIVVAGILILSLGCALGSWLRTNDERLQAQVDAALAAPRLFEPDHVDCVNDDCDQVICCCHETHGQPAECTGTTTLGCGHEGLCWECRLRCRECAFEQHTLDALDWTAGR